MYDGVKRSLTHRAPVARHLNRLDDALEAEGVEAGINERLVLIILEADGTPLFHRAGPSCWLDVFLVAEISHHLSTVPVHGKGSSRSGCVEGRGRLLHACTFLWIFNIDCRFGINSAQINTARLLVQFVS